MKIIYPEYKPDIIIGDGILRLNYMEKTVTYNGKHIELSPKELDLLYLLAQKPDWIFPREVIYSAVWEGGRDDVPRQTVENAIWKIRKKMGHDIIETVTLRGYRLGIVRRKKGENK